MAESLTEKQTNSNKPVTPFKLGMIGVLALILLYLLFDSDEGSQSSQSTRRETQTPRATVTHPSRAVSPSAHNKTIAWPEFSLDETLVHNPFAMPDPSKKSGDEDKTAQKRLEELFSELRTQHVNLILESPEGSTAILGSKVVRKGDVIDGFRIIDIQPDGVVVEVAQ